MYKEDLKHETGTQSGHQLFQRYLTIWVAICMVLGVLIGKFLPGIPAFLNQFEYARVSIPMAILIWLMIYPMMMKVDFRSIRNVGKNPKGLFVTWITTIGLLLTLVMIFSFQGNIILENPLHIVLIGVPLILQTFLIFAIAYIACHALKLPHRIAVPAGMIGASNFFELAVVVAIALFGTTSPAALATTVGALTEVPVMLFLVRIANRTKNWF